MSNKDRTAIEQQRAQFLRKLAIATFEGFNPVVDLDGYEFKGRKYLGSVTVLNCQFPIEWVQDLPCISSETELKDELKTLQVIAEGDDLNHNSAIAVRTDGDLGLAGDLKADMVFCGPIQALKIFKRCFACGLILGQSRDICPVCGSKVFTDSEPNLLDLWLKQANASIIVALYSSALYCPRCLSTGSASYLRFTEFRDGHFDIHCDLKYVNHKYSQSEIVFTKKDLFLESRI